MKLDNLERVSPTRHNGNVASQVFRIYIKNSFHRPATQQSVHSSGSLLPMGLSAAENTLSKNSILRTLKQVGQEAFFKEKRLFQLKREESSLAQDISRLRKKLKANNYSQHASSTQSKPATASQVNINKQNLPKRHIFEKFQNNSLYERERQSHFQNLRRSNSFVRSILAERKIENVYSRKLQRNKIVEQKTKIEQNHKMYKTLVKIRQAKQRENDCLKYEQISLQAKMRTEELDSQQKAELARLQKLRQVKENIEREISKQPRLLTRLRDD